MVQDPVRAALDARGKALAAETPSVYYDVNGGVDYSATSAAQTRYAQAIGTNFAMTDILGRSNDGDYQRVTFLIYVLPSALPQVMSRRGVSRDMFKADMAMIKSIYDTQCEKQRSEDNWACCTCGLSWCFSKAGTRSGDDLGTYLADMNLRYEEFNITWGRTCIPYVGEYIFYET